MPGLNDTSPPAGHSADDHGAEHRLSRRSVLGVAAGAGVAGVAASTLIGSAIPAFAASARPDAHDTKAATKTADADTSEQIVVHVRDARAGEIDVFRGTSHIRVQDRELAARLVRASR